MKILILTKRQYTNKDLIDDQYGRLFEIPEELANQGHQVVGLVSSYRKRKEGQFKPKNVTWHSINVIPLNPFDAIKHIKKIKSLLKAFNPDVVWVSSDAWNIIAAIQTCKIGNAKLVVDFYDNYESFTLSKLPLITKWMRASCTRADGFTVASSMLQELLVTHYPVANKPIITIGNAINREIFYPRDKLAARQALKLPQNAILIGTAGTLHANRGIETLFNAFNIINTMSSNMYLVVAGPRDNPNFHFSKSRIIDLGILSYDKIPLVYSALDIAIICNINSDFGKYCYPQKLQEILACRTPILAAKVGEMLNIFQGKSEYLFSPLDPNDLALKIAMLLKKDNKICDLATYSWQDRTNQLIDLINTMTATHPH